MKSEHKAVITEYQRLKRLYWMDPYDFLRSRWAEHPEKYLSLRGMSYESVTRLAESYRKAELIPILEKLRNERIAFVDSWRCRRMARHFWGAKAQAAALVILLLLTRGCEIDGRYAHWDPERMLRYINPAVGIIILAAFIAMATGQLSRRVTGRKIPFSVRFSALLSLILIAILFRFASQMLSGR